MVPRSLIGCRAHTCPHLNCPPLSSPHSVFKMQNWMSPVSPSTYTSIALRMEQKDPKRSGSRPWVSRVMGSPSSFFDHRAFACVIRCWEFFPCSFSNPLRQLKRQLLKGGFSGFLDISRVSYTIAPSFLRGDVAFISVILWLMSLHAHRLWVLHESGSMLCLGQYQAQSRASLNTCRMEKRVSEPF